VRLILAMFLLGSACDRPNPAFRARPADSAVVPAPGGDGPAAEAKPSEDVADPDRAPPGDMGSPVDAPLDLGSPVDAAAEAPLAADGVPSSALLGHWTFEEQADDPMVLDRSGNGHHARLENLDLAITRVPSAWGMALSFPASAVNPGAMVPVTSSPIRSLQRFTVAAWVYRPSIIADDEQGIISRQIGTGPRQVFNLGFQDDELVISLSQPTGTDVMSLAAGNTKTPVATWFHVAATWDGGALVLYQSGRRVAAITRAWTLPDTTNPLYLGTNKNANNDEPLVGMLDDVRLYSVALTDGQIAALASDQVP
jgi:hypothetical protein